MVLKLAGGKTLTTSRKSFVMGILNATPDSFYSGSRKPVLEDGVNAAKKMIHDGADILDIGGESTRPGSDFVEADEEIKRVIPLINAIREFSDVAISIDTRKSKVADSAIRAGADIINDVSAMRDDSEIGIVASENDVPVILMHMRGTPQTMQRNPHYTDAVEEIINELEICVGRAKSFGVSEERLILDPGIGFGKRLEDNLMILKNLDRFKSLGFPVLVGLSRKSFLGQITGADVENRLTGSISANMYSAMKGADILRVHDVQDTIWMLDIISAVEGAGI